MAHQLVAPQQRQQLARLVVAARVDAAAAAQRCSADVSRMS
jgi:hypothetical protein